MTKLNISAEPVRRFRRLLFPLPLFAVIAVALAGLRPANLTADESTKATGISVDAKLVPLNLKLPSPAFLGTPQNIPVDADVEPMTDKPRPPLMVPEGLKNLAPGSTLTCSDTNVRPTALAKIIDGDKQAMDTSVVLLRKGSQFVQFDLGSSSELFAIVIWHAHDAPKFYRDVIVQVADDPTFSQNPRTLFNNDKDNSSGRGAGADREYFESHEGKLISANGAKARYVRLYSRGSSESALNEYTEVEIYGRPPK